MRKTLKYVALMAGNEGDNRRGEHNAVSPLAEQFFGRNGYGRVGVGGQIGFGNVFENDIRQTGIEQGDDYDRQINGRRNRKFRIFLRRLRHW